MTFYAENETDTEFPFDYKEMALEVIKEVALYEKCPYEIEVSLVITNQEGIRAYNKEYRQIDKETDVLSFPTVDYDQPSDFSYVYKNPQCYLNPENKELILGDIILCDDRIFQQAKEYGHSIKREFCFLITHSMLHLFGYDHMTPREEEQMFKRQNEILTKMGICR